MAKANSVFPEMILRVANVTTMEVQISTSMLAVDLSQPKVVRQ